MQALAVTGRELRRCRGRRRLAGSRQPRHQVVSRYETFEQLLDPTAGSRPLRWGSSCSHLRRADPERVGCRSRVCAGLQVVEHLQDIAEDHRRGRVYMPREDLVRLRLRERGS